MIQLPVSLRGLARYDRFLICKLVPRKDRDGNPVEGKMDKVPLNPANLRPYSPKDPAAWLSADAAIKMLNAMEDPEYILGFWFTKEDPYFFLDIDGAAVGDQWSPIALDLLNRFNGAAVEVSQSGTGLHIIGTGYVPDHSCKDTKAGLELYTDNRLVALSLMQTSGDCETDHTKQLAWLVENHFTGSVAIDDGEWNDTHVEGSSPIEDDEVLINKALASKSVAATFGGKASFKQLWENDEDALAEFWPPDKPSDPYDRSHADMALAQHLAFWTGGSHDRILRLMQRSALKRDKWEARGDYYLPMTIRKAVTAQSQFYNKDYRKDDRPEAPVRKPIEWDEGSGEIDFQMDATPNAVSQTLFEKEQMELFKGMVYVAYLDKIYDSNAGMFFTATQFKNYYGGYKFRHKLEGKPTEDAWKAFTHNECVKFPKVHITDLEPLKPPGSMWKDEETSKIIANLYQPPNRKLVEGDAGPLIDLLERMVPDDRDRDMMLSYYAALVQHPGKKFRYALIMQGEEGNGKSTLNEIAKYAIGKRYTYTPKASDLVKSGGKFNIWMAITLFCIVEEITLPKGADFEYALKQYITGTEVEIEGKGVDQRMSPIRMNWVFNINDKLDFSVSRNNRRWCVIYTAQQSAEDLIRDGMDEEYWQIFYNWYQNGGLEIAANYLMTYPVNEEFNPMTRARAPLSSSHGEAVTLGLTPQGSMVRDAIEHERQGFCNGWISSVRLAELLDNGRNDVGPQRRGKIPAELGYILHPHLPEGKASRSLTEEGGLRPKLYVKQGSILCNLTDPKAILDRYLQDQGYSVVPNGAKNFGSS